MLASALTHPVVVTAEDGVRRGGAGSAIESALSELAREVGSVVPSVVTLGLPDDYLPHNRPDSLLSDLGLDGAGLAATVLAALGTPQVARQG
jgi:1-deoxy-D-xylulose-5-phosphate synthase